MKRHLEKSHVNRENSIVGIERIRFKCARALYVSKNEKKPYTTDTWGEKETSIACI